MNGVIGMTQLALETQLTGEQRQYLTSAISSAKSLLTIINDILDFSKIDANKLDLENIPFSLGDCISEVISSLAIGANENQIFNLAAVSSRRCSCAWRCPRTDLRFIEYLRAATT